MPENLCISRWELVECSGSEIDCHVIEFKIRI